MAEDNNTRSFSYDFPTYYAGATYPSRVESIEDNSGIVQNRKVFADANGNYYAINNDGKAVPALMSGEVPEVVITAPKENLLSQRFNDYLAMNNDATYTDRSLAYMTIRPDLSFNAALRRAVKPYSNYSEALDAPFSEEKENLVNAARYVKDNFIENFPTRASNCTLSATQWVNPANPINRAPSIVNEPNKYNYTKIDSIDALPGDLLIAKVPNKDSYHTMMVTGFAKRDKDYNFRGKSYKAKEGEPLLTYSRGGNSLGNMQFNVPLSVYTEHSDGHTENMFFRHNNPYRNFLLRKIIQNKR